MREYVETADGVHLVSPIGGSEHTLCGDAFDNKFDEQLGWKKRSARALTCAKCVAIVLHCRNVRVGSALSVLRPSSTENTDG